MPDATRPVSLPPAPKPGESFNHRTVAIFVIAIGLVGCFVEVAGPATVVPRLVLFAGVLAAGVFYLVRVLRRSRRRRRFPIETLGRSWLA